MGVCKQRLNFFSESREAGEGGRAEKAPGPLCRQLWGKMLGDLKRNSNYCRNMMMWVCCSRGSAKVWHVTSDTHWCMRNYWGERTLTPSRRKLLMTTNVSSFLNCPLDAKQNKAAKNVENNLYFNPLVLQQL